MLAGTRLCQRAGLAAPVRQCIRALLLAYASAAVWAVYEEAESANALFWLNLSRLASAQLATQSRAEQQSVVSEESLRPEVDYRGALDAMHNSKKDAVTVDKALFEAINRELGWTPQPMPVSTGLQVFRRS
jgi:hypothetical protein